MRWLDGITDMNLKKLQEMVEDSAAWRAAVYGVIKNDAVEVLHSICQPIWKTQQRPHDWKMSIFIPIPKNGNAKECSNYRTIALISHASKVKLKIF